MNPKKETMQDISISDACRYKHINKLTGSARDKMLEAPQSLHIYLNSALMDQYNNNLCGCARALLSNNFTVNEAVQVIYATDGHREPRGNEVEQAVNTVYSTDGEAPKSEWPRFTASTDDIVANLKKRGITAMHEGALLAELGSSPEVDDVADFIRQFFDGVYAPIYLGTRYEGIIESIDTWLAHPEIIEDGGYDQMLCNPMRRKLTVQERSEMIEGKNGKTRPKYSSGGRCLEFANESLDVVTFECDNHELLDRQLGVILYLSKRLPLLSIVHSGGKSYHATFSLKGLPDSMVHPLRKALVDLGADGSVLNPVHLTRLGAVKRSDSGAKQRVVWINSEARGQSVDINKVKEIMETDKEEEKRKLPAVTDADSLMETFTTRPECLIEGVIGVGDKLILSASSKAGKTWLMLHLAYAVQNGDEWLGHQCKKADVLYVNFELTEPWLAERFRLISRDKHFQEPPSVLNLRGFNVCWTELSDHIKEHIEQSDKAYGLIILDPIYKMLGDTDENSNGEVAMLLNALERMGHETKTATAFSHHHSKGNKSGVDAIERMSGAGVWGREPDAIIDLTAHEEDNHWVVDTTARNYSKPAKVVVRCDFPNFVPVDDLDPDELKKPGGSKKKLTEANVLDMCSTVPLGLDRAELCKKLAETHKVSVQTARSRVSEMTKNDKLWEDGKLIRAKDDNNPF